MTSATLPVHAHPSSRQERIRWDPWRRRWEVHVLAPAVEGAANDAVLALLAATLGVPLANVRLLDGARSRRKRVTVDGLDAAEVERRLRATGDRPSR